MHFTQPVQLTTALFLLLVSLSAQAVYTLPIVISPAMLRLKN
ncbi:MAG: hypothetical protein NTZ99_08185 [Burkholderiales bacterium]|nr:hypothetical protein [Burkholderiales bacterium]